MKWASTFSGELANSAFYFSPFGNVNNDNKSIVNASLGQSEQCLWKPWVYEERLQVATKVKAKRKELGQTRLAKSTKRTKLLDYIRGLNSRQEITPLLGPLVDKIFAEPLHNSNNACQQLHELMLVHANDNSKLAPNCTNPVRDVPGCALASRLTEKLGLVDCTRRLKSGAPRDRRDPSPIDSQGKRRESSATILCLS